MSHSKIKVQVNINSAQNKVWDCYTNPTHIVNWNFADPSWHCPNATNDMQIGGIYKARMEAKDGSFGFDFEAVYTSIVQGKNFTYEFGGRFATVELNDLGDKTEMVVVFDPENQNPIEMQQSGWQMILNNFKDYTESIN